MRCGGGPSPWCGSRHGAPDNAGGGVREATVKTHLHIYAKLGVSDRAAAVAEAFSRGLLTPESRNEPGRR